MAQHLSILCVHGVGHGDEDPKLRPAWEAAITENLLRARDNVKPVFDFLPYDPFFEHAPLNPRVYAEAMARLLASGVLHGVSDFFVGTRGIFDLPAQIRWTAGMVAQWASEMDLRAALRRELLARMAAQDFDVVCAHSLGSLLCYDTFRRNPQAIRGKTFLTFGSQIGNPFVRDCFGGRIEPLPEAARWYHLYNPSDHVLTAKVRLEAGNYAQVSTEFDKPKDVLNHDPVWYFDHVNTRTRVWPEIAGARVERRISRSVPRVGGLARRPQRRALLIGIDAYPRVEQRLEGCVNDTFLMSAVLQECGFRPEDIRVVLDDRATAANILERLHWLLDDVPDQGERVLVYSGHGAQIPTYGADGEVDHLDECLVPHDFDWTPEHAIRDNQFLEFYSQLPYGSRFVAVLDCCHSGGMTREGGPRTRGLDPPDDIRHRAMEWDAVHERWLARDLTVPNRELARSKRKRDAYLGEAGTTYRFGRGVPLRGLPSASFKRERAPLGHLGPYLPVLLEACQEGERASEHREGNTSHGAFTYALAKALREMRRARKNPTFRELTAAARRMLRTLGYEQSPCLVGPKKVLATKVPWNGLTGRRSTRKKSRPGHVN